MTELTYPEVQSVPYRQAALLNNTGCGCGQRAVTHQNGFGNVTLRGGSKYLVIYSCNIAVGEGETVGEIDVGITVNGEIVTDSVASVTPAAVGDFWNASGFKIIMVPCGCCRDIAIENISPASGTTPNPAIDIRNLNVGVIRLNS